MYDAIAIVGPTASGKTALSIELAKKLNGEVISCDSMQIYKYMDIGTAKPSKEEMCGIPHHMIDIISPKDEFSCSDYADMVKPILDDIKSRGKTPIFCGGTGLYLDTLVNHSQMSDSGKSDEIRQKWETYAKENGNEKLHDYLAKIDPDSANAIHQNNVRRVIRAIEIFETTGKTKTEWDLLSKQETPDINIKTFVLDFINRDLLYERIDKRVDLMVEAGLKQEVSYLLEKDLLPSKSTASQAIGYKEYIDVIKNGASEDLAIEEIKKASRHYAKRQITWFKRLQNATFIHPDENYESTNSLKTPGELLNEIECDIND